MSTWKNKTSMSDVLCLDYIHIGDDLIMVNIG